jgi:DNA-binding CsgD family transcriptional regulator
VTAPDGRVLHANAAAAELFRRGDGFALDDAGLLTVTDAAMAPSFARAVGLAALGRAPHGRVVLHVPGLRPDAPHAVSITMGADAPGVAAIIAISSPRLDDLAVAKLLRDQYGLTAAEAALAVEIGGGRTNEDAARALGKSAATGREQLHKIFGKMSGAGLLTRGQLELSRWVAVLASITGAARTRGKH